MLSHWILLWRNTLTTPWWRTQPFWISSSPGCSGHWTWISLYSLYCICSTLSHSVLAATCRSQRSWRNGRRGTLVSTLWRRTGWCCGCWAVHNIIPTLTHLWPAAAQTLDFQLKKCISLQISIATVLSVSSAF